MGVIIAMNSETFQKKFLKEVEDVEKYQYVLISQDVKQRDVKGKRRANVMTMSTLLPSTSVVSLHANGEVKAYKQAYLNQLQNFQCDAAISVLIKAAAFDDLNIVMVCSKSEEDRGDYLSLIREYIEAEYKLKTYTWKKYAKDPEKAEKIKNKDDVLKIVGKKFEKLRAKGVDLANDINIDDEKAKLEKLSLKKLRKVATGKGIEWDEDMSEKKLIKKIIKKMSA